MKKQSVLYGRRRASRSAACSLGLFGIALGLAELLAPRALAAALGLRGSEAWIRACGIREIATSIGILTVRDATPWMWARVAGDAVDLATLGAGFSGTGKKGALTLAAFSVAGVTMADVATSQVLSELRAKARTSHRDYSDRSGIRRPAAARKPAFADVRV